MVSEFYETERCYKIVWEREEKRIADFEYVKNIRLQRKGYALIFFSPKNDYHEAYWSIFENNDESLDYRIE